MSRLGRHVRVQGPGLLGLLLAVALFLAPGTSRSQVTLDPASRLNIQGYSASEAAGHEVWFYATGGNQRFFTYVFQQRLGGYIDWYRVLNTDERDTRFRTWGIINDPGCCVPGRADCPARSKEETYGFDWCPGDDELLKFVGKEGYRDPACDLADAPLRPDDLHGPADQRQDPCDLSFGTSTGGMGLRKFPNPRFDADAWRALNGSLGTWEGYNRKLSDDPATVDSKFSHIQDASVEPPFLIGMACGACHIAFNPLNPPADPEAPEWEHLDGLVGNQYNRITEIFASGLSEGDIVWQLFTTARPGTVDTSALPNDQVNNPGTMNAIINIARRPEFEHDVLKWRKAGSCPADADERQCWCEPGRDGKCWERSLQTEEVRHILKGGEDSIGVNEAVQRVYFNIGSCSEQCWVNHITDLYQADPQHRGFGQTPFDIGQCRRDCANFRAIEDRLDDVVAFLLTARPTDLYKARGFEDPDDLAVELNQEFGEDAVDRGRLVFAETCARCHSSQSPPFETVDFHATDPTDPSLRLDWLGNDRLELASEIGTYRSRALHSNHMAGRVWEEYGSETLRAKPPDATLIEPSDGGRGYYRNISLLSVWAHAPFMHHNAIGPEICGAPPGSAKELYRSPYVDADGKALANPPDCWPFDPSVDGRFALYKASMDALLNPDQRIPKMTLVDRDVRIELGPRIERNGKESGFSLLIPKGTPAAAITSLRHKDLIGDLVLSKTDPERLHAKYAESYGDEDAAAIVQELKDILKEIVDEPEDAVQNLGAHRDLLFRLYANSLADVENVGHRFGEDLSAADKKALIAFMATL